MDIHWNVRSKWLIAVNVQSQAISSLSKYLVFSKIPNAAACSGTPTSSNVIKDFHLLTQKVMQEICSQPLMQTLMLCSNGWDLISHKTSHREIFAKCHFK